MLRTGMLLAIGAACVFGTSNAIFGQVGNTNQGRTVGSSLGGTTQGGRLSQSNIGAANSSVALSSRFQSDSSRFQSGSQALGQTTAGLGAIQGVMGGGQFSSFGSIGGFGGRGGLTSSLFGLSAMRGLGGRGFGGGIGQQGATQQQGQQQIRTHLAIAFPNPLDVGNASPQAQAIRTKTMARVARSLRRAIPDSVDRVQVRLDGATAVLTGSVASDHQKKIVELLVKMEPGIADVRNELTVGRLSPTQ